MELKEIALATICISLFILLMGILTGGILFYAAAALFALLIVFDHYRLVKAKRDILKNVEIKSGLSRNEVYLRASTQLVCRLINNGTIGHRLRIDLPLDDSIRSDGVWNPIELSAGSTVYLKMMLEPSAGGMFMLKPPEITVESWLFEDSFPYGKKLQLNVLLPVGINIDRVGPKGLRSKPGLGMFDAMTIKRGQGLDFRVIRKYVGGDNTRHIDWVRSNAINDLMVRDYEDEQPLPVFFFIDLDHTMGIGGEPTALHAAVNLTTELINKYLMNGERIGLTGFMHSGVANFMPPRMGNDHLYNIRGILSNLKTIDADENLYRHEQETLPYELKYVFRDKGQAGILIEELLHEYTANAENDGFSKAIRSAIRYLNTQSRMVVITNLSIGMTSLMNNARIAMYYGHKVSVVLIPHTWHEEEGQADAEADRAVYMLKANGIEAIVMHPGEKPDSVIKRGGLTNVKVRVRR